MGGGEKAGEDETEEKQEKYKRGTGRRGEK
jgi:hypothetical protein